MDKTLEVTQQSEVPAEMNFYRIEALRAASRIIAGKVGHAPEDAFYKAFSDTSMGAAADATLTLAEQYAKWLETGER